MKKLLCFIIFVVLLCIAGNAQNPCQSDDLCVIQFNASFNSANEVDWINKLNDCSTSFIDIATNAEAAAKYKIVVVPTILIFNGGEEVARFQANIMMTMEATKKDIQNKIDEIIMEDF